MMKEIINFYIYNDTLAAGGQPTENQIESLKDEGFEAVVNISPASTKNYLDSEAGLTEQLGMDYVHYPIDCSNLQDIHYKIFKSILGELGNKKVFVHCGGNIKSSNLIHMYNVLEKGINEQESLLELKTIQQPEEKWFSYFKHHGMQGN